MEGMTRHALDPSPSPRVARPLVSRGDCRRFRGVTLVETMIVVAVVGILLKVAVPSFSTYLGNLRVSAAANDLLRAMMLARGEAMKRGQRVYIAPTGGHWRDGWAVFVDRDDDRRFTAAVDTLIAQHDPMPASLVVTNPANATREPFTDLGSPQRTYVLFEGSGYARQRNGAFAAGSLAISDRGGGTAVRTLCLASLGRVRIVDRPSC
jgi:type IV fimbrial biogenesis protein FimT